MKKSLIVIIGIISIAITTGILFVLTGADYVKVGPDGATISKNPEADSNVATSNSNNVVVAGNNNEILIDSNKNKIDEFTKVNSLEHQRILKTFEEGRPFSIEWTSCNMSIEYDKDKNILEYIFSIKPIILDKEQKRSLISFNTSYKFNFEGLILNYTEYTNLEHRQISKHTVTPASEDPVILNLKNVFDQAEKRGATSVKIIMDEASLTPYSDVTDRNLSSYDDVLKDKIVKEFIFVPQLNKWAESSSDDNTICNDLYEDLPN